MSEPMYASGALALQELASARALLAAIRPLQQRLSELSMRLMNAASEADWRAREALKAIDGFAATDPAQIGARPSNETLELIERGTDRVWQIEQQVAEILRTPREDG